MTAFYDFFRFIKLYSTDGVTLEHTIEADAVTDILSISRGAGVSWAPTDTATDSFKIDVDYTLEVPVATTTIRLTDVNSNDQDIALVAGSNMNFVRDNANQLTISALVGGISKAIDNITQSDPCNIETTNPHNFTEGTPVTITDVTGMTQLNGNEYYMDILTGTIFSLYSDPELTTPVDSTGFGAYTSGGVATGEYGGATKLNELSDVKAGTADFTDSIMIGHITTGTLNNAYGNIFIGKDSGKLITSGHSNTFIGVGSGDAVMSGDRNIILGDYAGSSNMNDMTVIANNGNIAFYNQSGTVTIDGSGLDQYIYNNLGHFNLNHAAVRITGESGSTIVTSPPYEVTYLERSNMRIDAAPTTITHTPARLAIGGGTLAIHGGDGLKQVSNVITERGSTWAADGLRTAGTYTSVAHDGGWPFNGTPPTFTVVVAVGGAVTSVIPEGPGSGIYFFNGTDYFEIADSSIGNGGASNIECEIDPAYTTQAKLTMIGDTTLAVTTTGGTLNGNPIVTSNSISGTVTGHLIPDADATYDLGSSTYKFRDLHLDGASFFLGGHKIQIEQEKLTFGGAVISDVLQIAADDSTIRTVDSGESIKFSGAGTVTTASDAEGNIVITGSAHTPALGDLTDVHNAAPTEGQVLTWVNANSRWEPVTDVETDITGSVFGDDSTLLVDGVNSTINLDGTIRTHLIPAEDAVYDIGSASKKIRDLYVDGGGSLWIGTSAKIEIAPYEYASATFNHFVELTGVANEPSDSHAPRLEGVAISPDGTKLYVPQADRNSPLPDYMRIVQFTLGTPFDLSTITNTVAPANSLDVQSEINSLGDATFSAGDTSIGGIHFKPDGTKLYMLTGTSIGGNPEGQGAHYHSVTRLVEYTLSTPWDITTGSYTAVSNDPNETFEPTNPYYSLLYYIDGASFKISDDGRFLYTTSGQTIKSLEMATPWDITSFPWRPATLAGDPSLEDDDFKIYTTKRWHDSQGLEKDTLDDIWFDEGGYRWFGLFSHGLSNDAIVYGYTMTTKFDIKTSVPIGADIVEITANGYNPPFPDSIIIAGNNHPNGSEGQQTGMSDVWGDWVQALFFADNGHKLYVTGYYLNYPSQGAGGVQEYGITDAIDSRLTVKGTKGVKIEGDIILANGVGIDEFSTDGTLEGGSDKAVPTEKAVKTYVDNVGSGIAVPGSSVAGDVLYHDGAIYTRLAKGADGQVLTLASGLPSWAAGGGGGGGGWSLISTSNITTSITSFILAADYSAYSQLKIVMTNMLIGADQTRVKMSNDDGSTYCNWDQYSATVYNDHTPGFKGTQYGWGQQYAYVFDDTFRATADQKAMFEMDIYFDGNDICYSGRGDGNDSGGDHCFVMCKGTGGAITSVNHIEFENLAWTGGQVRLYGLTT